MDVFTAEDAVAYLTRAAPEVPVGPDPEATVRIAHRCGYLPLALGLVAGQMRVKPGWTLTDHADRLDERRHTRHLDSGVELALDLSYQQLAAGPQRLFRLLTLHPAQDFDVYAAAAVVGGDLSGTEADLDHLLRDHLVQRDAADRYTFHDLVRAYGIGRATEEDPPPARHAALTRLFDYYLATAAAAMDITQPAEVHRRPKVPPCTTPTPTLTDHDTGRGWLDTERPTLVAVAAHTAGHGWARHTTRLSTTLYRYLNGGYHSDALALHGHALQAADTGSDLTERAHILVNLGTTQMMLGQYEAAAQHLRQALAASRQAGDSAGQARALTNLANLEAKSGNLPQSANHHKQARRLYREAGDPAGVAGALANLGHVEALLGHLQPAVRHFEQALTQFRHNGNSTGEAWVLTILAEVETQLHRYESATAHLRQALTLANHSGDKTAQARTLDSLGTLQSRRGMPAHAADHLQQSLALFREIGERDGEASALNGLGETARATSQPTRALTHHEAAHTIAVEIGEREQHARAHAGLGRVHHDLGQLAVADRHYRRALTLYTDLGMPEADQVRAELTTIDAAAEPPAVTPETT
jgi:tetratricopeptide (TPR) repeat protein